MSQEEQFLVSVESAKGLFKFLKDLSELKTKKVFDLNKFERVLWFNDIPLEKECFSITHNLKSETINFDKWIEIKKPKIRDFPEPHAEIEEWIKEETLENFNSIPECYEYIIHEIFDEDGESKDEKIYLDSSLNVKENFSKYLVQQWTPWATERKRLEGVVSIYNTLFEIYHKNKTQGENFQVLLGVGLLHTKTRKEKPVKRHIVTSPLSLKFNPANGTITIGPGEQNVELSLELDMFETSEKPDNSDEINELLSELSNDFWTNDDFFSCLSSWVNRYDSESQFSHTINSEPSNKNLTTLSLSPAIIFRKRGERVFSKFYADVISDLDNCEEVNPCLEYISNEGQDHSDARDESGTDDIPLLPSDKYYFPLPVNAEQRSIITKIASSIGVIVQGPPGTGKTHSIANIICHLLATGKKVLITSQTDRALKVLKNKLPPEVRPLCVEVLGQDQKSLMELKNSVDSINSKYQEWNSSQSKSEISRLNKKDDNLKSELIEVERRILEIKGFETRLYENLFDFYSGTAASIASQLKEQTFNHSWILGEFSLNDSSLKSPISNEEAHVLFKAIDKLKGVSDNILEEPIDFLDKVLTQSEFREKMTEENDAISLIEKNSNLKSAVDTSKYNIFQEDEFETFYETLSKIVSRSESLENIQEDWITQARNECLSDRDRPWRHLHQETVKILNEYEDRLLLANKNKFTGTPEVFDKVELSATIGDFSSKFNSEDKISWGLFCSSEVRSLKKILKEMKLNGRKINSYNSVMKLKDWVDATLATEELVELWGSKVDIETSNLGTIFHIFKDLCEPLEQVLALHQSVSELKSLIELHPDIHDPKWELSALTEELQISRIIKANKTVGRIGSEFQNYIALLSLHKGQNNNIAKKIISAYENRNFEEFEFAVKDISDFINYKKEFQILMPIKRKIDAASGNLFKSLRKAEDFPLWEERLKTFEQSWAWGRGKSWIKENGDSDYLKKLTSEREDLVNDIQRNLELLVASKSWGHCLSNITSQQQASLKGWAHAVSKIGKGTGKTAPKHRKVAKERMSECKGAIPAWIMPLYRVVESIKPGSELFDVAIIDEASQTGPEGLLLNYLAKKIIVVGDNEQISPEMPGVLDNDVELLKRKYLKDIKFSDHIGREYSYYDYCDICFTSQVQLREHFRCMPEIIQFSNVLSYSGKPLVPMRQYGSTRLQPLKHTYIEGAISKIGSAKAPQNDREAETIVETLLDCVNSDEYKNKTFGIISLQGNLQIKRIEAVLEVELDKEVIEEREIIVGSAYDFQGDERDVIFLSLGVSNDYNFTALTKSNYKKRYNVAASRAKDQMWLFHSVRIDELSQHCFRRQLLSHCTGYEDKVTGWPREHLQELYKKIKVTKDKTPRNAPHPFDSWFETRIFLEIANRGYLVIPQFEVSGYRIDMVVIGSKGRLAVECDGDIYHAEEHEESDLSRQWDLERCGWTFWRVRSSAFYLDLEESLKGLWKELKKMKIHPLGHEDAPDENIDEKYKLEDKLQEEKTEEVASPKFDVTSIRHPDPRENSIKGIADGLLEIIKLEGPIVTTRLYRLYVRSCGVSKVGGQIKKKLHKASLELKTDKKVFFEKEQVIKGVMEGIFYLPETSSTNIRPNSDRSIEDIPLSELREVMKKFGHKDKNEDEIFRSVLEFYGFKRLTSVAINRLKKASAD